MHITSEQMRAARALLRWDQKALSEASGVPLTTLKRVEAQSGPLAAHGRTIAALQGACERNGIIFLNDGEPGVRLRKP
ncbi:transcriptional regulator [Methylobacterium sp. NEAU 140]|uniref:transcriptional regulator n=1 Tax=Methylobacterium sp. NEAU 140 TaxID=3064945 RepID=UPI002733705B|nr:transcriptional regulator [Methylobacterium sp. NEAU 140]MDP4022327.1 transcriptional regulator [Methylobacterium sp. NEAU 140]